MENINFYDSLEYREFKTLKFKRDLMVEYVMYMLDKTIPMFKWSGLPDTIPSRKLEELLQTRGCVAIVRHEDNTENAPAGLYAVTGGRGGERDAYYEPVDFVYANPALEVSATLKIGKECELIRNDYLYIGLMPLYTRYASLLTENAVSLRISDINLRALLTMGAPDDKTKASAELYLKRLEDGENAVIGESAFFDGVNYHDAAHPQNHMKDLIEYEQYLKASWFNELGLDANYNMKRERISGDEVNQNSDALIPLIQAMLNCRKECVEKVNALFGTNWAVELDSVWAKTLEQATETPDEETGDEPETEEETPEDNSKRLESEGGGDDGTNES